VERVSPLLEVGVFTGGHPFDAPAFQDLLGSCSGMRITVTEQPAGSRLLADPAQPLPQVLLLYDFGQSCTRTAQQRLLSAVSSGMGLVVMHHAIFNHVEWPEFRTLVGGSYVMAPTVIQGRSHGPSTSVMAELPVAILDPVHPITQGLAGFTLQDECYDHYYVADDVHPLLGTDHPASHRHLAWTRTHGRGRVVYLQSGHGPSAYAHPTLRTIFQRALRWAGRI